MPVMVHTFLLFELLSLKFKIRALFYLKSKGAIAIEEKGLSCLVGWKENGKEG